MALVAYRHLLRATRIAFQGDVTLLHAARAEARSKFEQLRLVDADSEAAQKGVQHAQEVADILTKNIVQGEHNGDTIKLRIHDEIERGDNNTIKAGGKKVEVFKACS